MVPYRLLICSKFAIIFAIALLLTSCAGGGRATTEIVQTEINRAVIFTSAVPVCGKAGALRVAQQMAAIATINQGYERFILFNIDTDSNVEVKSIKSPSTQTYGSTTTIGGTSYSNFSTYTPTITVISGEHQVELHVYMLNPNDAEFNNAIDARNVLGPEWQEKIITGISTCE